MFFAPPNNINIISHNTYQNSPKNVGTDVLNFIVILLYEITFNSIRFFRKLIEFCLLNNLNIQINQ